MRVPFSVVRMHFPDTDNVSREELYRWIGRPENIADANFYNTCAIRMSLALLGAGYPNPGKYPINAGKYRDARSRPSSGSSALGSSSTSASPKSSRVGRKPSKGLATEEESSPSSASMATRIHKGTSPSCRAIAGAGISGAAMRSMERRPAATGRRARYGSGRLPNAARRPQSP